MEDVTTPRMKGLINGRIVHYVTANGTHRAAVITWVWNHQGVVNLYVFPDGNMRMVNADLATPTSVAFDAEGKKLMSWHWIEKE